MTEPAAIPYGRQSIGPADVEAVAAAVQDPWLTTGPKVGEFEKAVAAVAGTRSGVAVNSGTAALHAACRAVGIGPGDEVLVPPMTFVATANAVVHCGGRPVFVDVDPGTLLMDPDAAARAVTPRTKAILAVDYAGQPCEWDRLRDIAQRSRLRLLDDACHALGATYRGKPLGDCAEAVLYSFHPVKHITTAEGGLVATNDDAIASACRRFRNHGLDSDLLERARRDTWVYDAVDFGLNYRLSDLQCALGISQMARLGPFLASRRRIAAEYDRRLRQHPLVEPLQTRKEVSHAYHLYVVRVRDGFSRDEVLRRLRARGIKATVHYPAAHLMSAYRQRFGTKPGDCPNAEDASDRILSLPMFPDLTPADQDAVLAALDAVARDPGARA